MVVLTGSVVALIAHARATTTTIAPGDAESQTTPVAQTSAGEQKSQSVAAM